MNPVTWPQTSHCPFATKSHAKGSNCVKWSWYTNLKINNKHQTKVSAHFVFSPVCEYSVLVYPIGFDFFSLKNESMKRLKNLKSEMPASECQVFGGLQGNWLQNFQFEFPVKKLREFVSMPTVSDWATFAVQISKDEALMPLLRVGLLFIFGHLSRIHLATLKIHSVSQTSPNFEQTTSPEVVNNSGNEATSLARILFLFA